MILCNLVLVVQIIVSTGHFVSSKSETSDDSTAAYMRINMVLCIMLNMLEFFNRVRIFDFFAYFVRQIQDICYDSLPLGSMLGLIVVA